MNMKKKLSVLIAVALAFSVLFTLTAPILTATADSSAKTPLKLWMPPFGTEDTLDTEFWTRQCESFAKENNVELSIEIMPWSSYEEKYITAITANAGPDVGYMYVPMIADHIKMETIAPLDSYLTPEDEDCYLYLDLGKTNGRQYTLPFIVGDPSLMYYNMDILNSVGVTEIPQTWDEFVAMGQKVQAGRSDVRPFQQFWADPSIGALNSMYYPFLWQAGGDLFAEDGKSVAFDSEKGLEAVQFLYDLKFKYKFISDTDSSLTYQDAVQNFLDGKAASAIMGTAVASQLDEKGVKWEAIASLKKEKTGTFIAVDCLVMLEKSEHKDLAWKLMKHMTSVPVMTAFHKEMAKFPPIGKGEEYKDNPKLQAIYDTQSEAFRPLPNVPDSFKVYDPLYKNLQLMMLGELSPEQAIADSRANAEAVLGQ